MQKQEGVVALNQQSGDGMLPKAITLQQTTEEDSGIDYDAMDDGSSIESEGICGC